MVIGDPVYVVVHAGHEGDTILWAGHGAQAARDAVGECRRAIAEAQRARTEILGDIPRRRTYANLTRDEREELERRAGPFLDGSFSPARVCVRREIALTTWVCSCQELGIELLGAPE